MANNPTLIDTDDGYRVPVTFTAVYDDPSRPFVAHVTVSVLNDHIPVLNQLLVVVRREDLGYRPPSPGELRLPLASIIDAAVRAADRAVKDSERKPTSENLGRPRRTRHVLTTARLKEIAEVTHDAETAGLPIRRAVAEHFRLGSEMTARNWIAAARKAQEPGGPLHDDTDTEEGT